MITIMITIMDESRSDTGAFDYKIAKIMLNPKQLIKFAIFSKSSDYTNFQKQKEPVYKLLPSTKFNKWTITYKSKTFTKYIIGNPIEFNNWQYLNKNEQFAEFNPDSKDLLMFNNLFDSIEYLQPNLNIKPPKLYDYNELKIRQKQHWNKT